MQTIAHYLRTHNNEMPTIEYTIVKCKACAKNCIRLDKGTPLTCDDCLALEPVKATSTIEVRFCTAIGCQRVITGNTNTHYCSTACKKRSQVKTPKKVYPSVKKVLTLEEKKEKAKKTFYKDLEKATKAVDIASNIKVYGQGYLEGKASTKLSGENKKLSKELWSLSKKEYNDRLEEKWIPYHKDTN